MTPMGERKQMKPTPAQRKVLEAMRDGKDLCLNKNNRRVYLYERATLGGLSASTLIRDATFLALRNAGWIDTDIRRESGSHIVMRLMPSARAALRRATRD